MINADMYLMTNHSFFPPEKMPYIRQVLSSMPEEHLGVLYTLDLKNPTTILLFSIFLGEFGVDRFMLGDTGLGVGKLLTLGGCLIWWFIDLFLVMGRAREVNFNNLMQAVGMAGMGMGMHHGYYGGPPHQANQQNQNHHGPF